MDRAALVHQNFLRRLGENDLPDGAPADPTIAPETLMGIFRSQTLSRQLDRASRMMQAQGKGFYTIGSSGHEGMAAVAEALRPTDMAFLHYRDAAFQIQRAAQVPGQSPVWDMLLSFRAASADPISGGRHKVLGSRSLNIPRKPLRSLVIYQKRLVWHTRSALAGATRQSIGACPTMPLSCVALAMPPPTIPPLRAHSTRPVGPAFNPFRCRFFLCAKTTA